MSKTSKEARLITGTFHLSCVLLWMLVLSVVSAKILADKLDTSIDPTRLPGTTTLAWQ